MKNLIRRIYINLFKPSIIIDRQLVSYDEADALIKADPTWELSDTPEDLLEANYTYVTKREYITE